MSPEDNKTIVARYAEDVWNNGNLTAVDEYIAADYVRHDPGIPMQIRGPEGIKQLAAMYRAAFPDIHFTADLMIAEGDKVAGRWMVRATHQGELMGIPATGKPVSITAIEIYRFVKGKIAEQWVVVDNLGMLQQLGVVPVPG